MAKSSGSGIRGGQRSGGGTGASADSVRQRILGIQPVAVSSLRKGQVVIDNTGLVWSVGAKVGNTNRRYMSPVGGGNRGIFPSSAQVRPLDRATVDDIRRLTSNG